MKKLTPIVLVALFGALTFMPSCKKSDNNSSTSQGKTMTATVNGKAFTATNVFATPDSNILLIQGSNSGDTAIAFTIFNYNSSTPATYTISTSSAGASYSTGLTLNDIHVIDSGAIVLTTATAHNAVGTFTLHSSFDSTTVTNGAFSVTW